MKRVTCILTMLLFTISAYSQQSQGKSSIEVFFDQNEFALGSSFDKNRESIEALSEFITQLRNDELVTISKVEIDSYTSPEGGATYNKKLSERRTASIYNYISETLKIPEELIVSRSSGIDWEGLAEAVAASDIPYRDEVLHIIQNVPEERWARVDPNDRWLTMVDSRNKHLMELYGGRAYNYIFENFYPNLRRGSIVTVYFKVEMPAVVEKPKEEALSEEVKQAIEEPKSPPPTHISAEPESISKPLFALKTNLLFDLATLINVELEVPIGNSWSVAGEWIFPWWTWDDGTADSNRHRIQLLNGNLEAKYWFGDRENRPVMTGWFAGLYAGGGLYDFERSAKGYQGEFFIAAGLSGGYAHTINKKGNLRMEYSLGLGYLKTDYRKYEAYWGVDDAWHPIRLNSGEYTWFGPTKARVSLVWLLNRNVKKGGAQ